METDDISASPPALHRHAGVRFDRLMQERQLSAAPVEAPDAQFPRVTIEGQVYSIVEGHLVPYYPSATSGEELVRDAEQFTMNRVKRFFYTAQPELDAAWQRADIERAMEDYLHCDDPDAKASKGRFLVGAMVNRIGRLASVYFHADVNAVANLDLTSEQREGLQQAARLLADLRSLRWIMSEHGGPNVTSREQKAIEQIRAALKPVEREFSEYFRFMVIDHPEAVSYVRLRNDSPDYDGVIPHLIREMSKEWGYEAAAKQKLATNNVMQHIGQTMQAIDEVEAGMNSLLGNEQVMTTLRRAIREYRDELPEASIALRAILDRGATGLVESFAACARARAGIKSEDATQFGPLREEIDLMRTASYEVLKHVKRSGREKGQAAISEARDLLSYGFELMGNMGQLRIPRNRHAPAFADQTSGVEPGVDNPKDQSSVRRFERKVDGWIAKQEKAQAITGR